MDNTINLKNETVDLNELSFLIPNKEFDEDLELSLLTETDDTFVFVCEEDTDYNTDWLNKKIKERELKGGISDSATTEDKKVA